MHVKPPSESQRTSRRTLRGGIRGMGEARMCNGSSQMGRRSFLANFHWAEIGGVSFPLPGIRIPPISTQRKLAELNSRGPEIEFRQVPLSGNRRNYTFRLFPPGGNWWKLSPAHFRRAEIGGIVFPPGGIITHNTCLAICIQNTYSFDVHVVFDAILFHSLLILPRMSIMNHA